MHGSPDFATDACQVNEDTTMPLAYTSCLPTMHETTALLIHFCTMQVRRPVSDGVLRIYPPCDTGWKVPNSPEDRTYMSSRA